MEGSQFSVAWQSHQKSICHGLTTLQQRGEFVDMTLAADGHLVKVHKMVMSLVSPYIKELITSVECSHPVLFLNHISYPTLCNILEYVYTGEVLLTKENLNEFVNAGRALHIRGLTNMNMACSLPTQTGFIQIQSQMSKPPPIVVDGKADMRVVEPPKPQHQERIHEVYIPEDDIQEDIAMENPMAFDDTLENDVVTNDKEEQVEQQQQPSSTSGSTTESGKKPYIQYSVSNQGNLQMVLNRYLYYLVYTGKNSGHRRWQCIDNHMKRFKCPAAVVTKNGVIVQRISAHNHPFHDQKIFKKVQSNAIFSGLHEAQNHGKTMQEEKNARNSTNSQDKNEDSDN